MMRKQLKMWQQRRRLWQRPFVLQHPNRRHPVPSELEQIADWRLSRKKTRTKKLQLRQRRLPGQKPWLRRERSTRDGIVG